MLWGKEPQRLTLFSTHSLFFGQGEMPVVDTFFPPGRAGRILTPIFTPVNTGSLTEQVSHDEGANGQAYTVIAKRYLGAQP
jgi:hypothetical protein